MIIYITEYRAPEELTYEAARMMFDNMRSFPNVKLAQADERGVVVTWWTDNRKEPVGNDKVKGISSRCEFLPKSGDTTAFLQLLDYVARGQG